MAAQIDRQRAAMWSQVTSDVAPGVGVVQLNLDPAYRHLHLRGIYLRVVSDGRVRVGDRIRVVQRGA